MARRAVLVVLAALAGCQTYEPRPLDPDAHRAAWFARSLAGESLQAFLARLAGGAGDVARDFDPADGLDLREGQLVALVLNPSLRLARQRVGLADAGVQQAGRWTDPTFQFALQRITASVPRPWVITPGLTFALPLSGRLEAERDLAAAERAAVQAGVREAEWALWRDVRGAWIEWSAARLRIEETERLVQTMEGLVRTATELAEQGEIPRTQATLLRVEQSQRRNRVHRLRGEVAAGEQDLRRLLGLPPTASVQLLPALELPAAADGATPAASAAEALQRRNPELARLRREYEVSERALRHEVRRQYRDLNLGPFYEDDEGQVGLGLLGSLPLPLFNANRRAIAEARAEREIARVALETTFEGLVGRWAAATARVEALTRQHEEMVRVLVPLVDGQVADTFELMRLGEGATTLVLLESLVRAFQTKLDLIDTRAAEALARTEVAFLIGPEATADPGDGEEETR